MDKDKIDKKDHILDAEVEQNLCADAVFLHPPAVDIVFRTARQHIAVRRLPRPRSRAAHCTRPFSIATERRYPKSAVWPSRR